MSTERAAGSLKMYILVREDVPLGLAVVAVAHASLAAYLRFREAPETAEWLSGPFRKVVCRVSQAEFETARTTPDHVVLTESSLGNREVALAFKPRAEWPAAFRHFHLYGAAAAPLPHTTAADPIVSSAAQNSTSAANEGPSEQR